VTTSRELRSYRDPSVLVAVTGPEPRGSVTVGAWRCMASAGSALEVNTRRQRITKRISPKNCDDTGSRDPNGARRNCRIRKGLCGAESGT